MQMLITSLIEVLIDTIKDKGSKKWLIAILSIGLIGYFVINNVDAILLMISSISIVIIAIAYIVIQGWIDKSE